MGSVIGLLDLSLWTAENKRKNSIEAEWLFGNRGLGFIEQGAAVYWIVFMIISWVPVSKMIMPSSVSLS
jgi:hypothetical protein